jgi:hypothetical protein
MNEKYSTSASTSAAKHARSDGFYLDEYIITKRAYS